MPRQPRYFLPDIPQHVIVRGVDRQATFFAPDDYALFKKVLLTNASIYGAAIHAYVLMTNHVHLLLTPFEKRSIPQTLQGLGRDYVQRINRQYGRSGTLWQGRYKASLVQDDLYLLNCQRYIELNPVRAGMVTDPALYPHSSYRRNALGAEDALISPHNIYEYLGSSDLIRHNRYRGLFNEELDKELVDDIRLATNACRVLGNDAFKDQIESMLKRRVRPAKIGRPPNKPIA
ncbi:MAG: transposase [Woeseiaceae bacterium]